MARLITLAIVLVLTSGCMALNQGENRTITAWGIWAVVLGAPVGVGYWHSERGPDVRGEDSAQPSSILKP